MKKVPEWKKNGRTKNQYLTIITEQFPQLTYSTSRLLKHGWDHDVVILDEQLVFRFPRKEYLEKFQTEVRILDALFGSIELPLPRYMYKTKDLSFGGYSLIEGTPLRQSLFKRLSAKKRQQCAVQLGRFFSQLHAFDMDRARSLGAVEEEYMYNWSSESRKKMMPLLREKLYPKLSDQESAWIEKRFEEFFALTPSKHKVLLHSDLAEDHILFSKEQGAIAGIIDFADMEIGDPAMDFCGLFGYGKDFVDAVYSHYTDTLKDPDFLKRSLMRRILVPVPHMLAPLIKSPESVQALSFEENRVFLKKRMEMYPL